MMTSKQLDVAYTLGFVLGALFRLAFMASVVLIAIYCMANY